MVKGFEVAVVADGGPGALDQDGLQVRVALAALAGVPIVIRAGKCMPVTATEVTITFEAPPQDVFGIEPMVPEDQLRFRIWPETAVSMTLHGKKPGAGFEPQAEELAFAQDPGSDIRPYDRLIGAALDGDRWLFARQDTV
ncbi:MAG TPA: hypothetical protein VMK84_19285, partial [Streptosporangiaceae bacterium]|nr:hypothetical protein [Streptosporangiaceae bacterium]